MKIDSQSLNLDLVEASVAFLATFDTKLKIGYEELTDWDLLCDFLLQCLHQICSQAFPIDSFESASQLGSSRSTAVMKLSHLGSLLDAYFRLRCHKSVAGLPLNADAIVANRDAAHAHSVLLSLMELVVGAAVLCDNRAVFIKRVLQLDPVDQFLLKNLVERYEQRCEELEDNIDRADKASAEEGVDGGKQAMLGEMLRAQEVVRHLHAERANTEREAQELSLENAHLKEAVAALRKKLDHLHQERAAADGSDRERALAAEIRASNLDTELHDCRRELDLAAVNADALQGKLRRADKSTEQAREVQMSLEITVQRQAGELEAAREKSARMLKAEALNVKFQQRLEELPVLKQENKEQLQLLEEYSSRISELESTAQEMAALHKIVESAKNNNVELELSKFEALSSVQMLKDEVASLEHSLETSKRANKQVHEELAALRGEMELKAAVDAMDLEARRAEAGDPESKAALRSRIRSLERELTARAGGSATGAGGDDNKRLAEDLVMCRAELSQTKEEKKGREELLLDAKKQLSNAQLELKRTARTLQDLQEQYGAAETALKDGKETTHKLLQVERTVVHLEDLLKEKEGIVLRLETERGKLEQFSKNTLAAFKNKFMSTLHKVQAEKEALEAALERLAERSEFDRETSRREERLLLSAVYNVGVKIMDKNMQASAA